MSYTLPAWADSPSTASPLSAANLLELNTAINDLDSRVSADVSSVTAADTTVTIGGTSTDPTVAVNTIAESQVTGLTTDLAAKQPLDSDLTAIAALTPTNDDVVQRKAGAWTNRTMAQLKTDLAVTPSDIGAVPTSRQILAGTGLSGGGNLTADRTYSVSYGTSAGTAAQGNDSRITGAAPAASPTLTGAIAVSGAMTETPVNLTDAATIAVDASLGNTFRVTLGASRNMGAPSNSTDGQKIMFAVNQGTGSHTISWATGTGGYVFGTDVTQPTLTTTASKTDYVGFIYSSAATAWHCIAVARGY